MTTAGFVPPGVTKIPEMIFNKNGGTFAIMLPEEYETNNMKVYFNTRLFSLFGNFYHTYNPANTNYEYELLYDRADGINVSILSTPPGRNVLAPAGYIFCSQEYEALFNLQEFTSIVFRSGQLGLTPEYAPNPNTSATIVQESTLSGVAESAAMITDLVPYFGSGDRAGIRGYQYYAPDAKRWIELNIDSIDNIDIQIYLRDKVGREIPYYIPPFSTASLKLVFARKDYINL
jgi:hypothetical protein